MKPPYRMPPSYWWEFRQEKNTVIVESDDDRFPVIGKFSYAPDSVDRAMPAIQLAEDLIADLKAGRKDPRRCAEEVESQSVK